MRPGDSVFTRKGERVIWDIEEDVTKVFSRTWAEVFHSKSTYTFPTEAERKFQSFGTLTLRCDSIAKRKPLASRSLFATHRVPSRDNVVMSLHPRSTNIQPLVC